MVKEFFSNADAILITAGAGMGVDSGLPDFRGTQGFWKAYPLAEKLGLSFSEMANPVWFMKKPRLAWAFYGHRLNLYRKTIPHEGFNLLLAEAKKKPGGYFVYTSNVDGHFHKAGFDADRIVEVHGSIHHFQCSQPCSERIWDAKDESVFVEMEKFEATGKLPVCQVCGAIARPNILMFGDWSWIPDRSSEQEDRLLEWLGSVQRNNYKLVVIELGAGLSVPTVRIKSESVAKNLNGKLIRINPRDFQVPDGHFSISKGALDGIRNILGN